jgi:prevent-host-death family protein
MTEVGVHEAKTHLSKLLERVLEGEEIVITRSGEPVARLVPAQRKRKPNFGYGRGTITMSENFDEIPEGFEDYI